MVCQSREGGQDFGKQFIQTFMPRRILVVEDDADALELMAIYQVRRRFHPLTYDEMIDIANLWVEAALTLEDAHVRRMTTLAAAQMRRQVPAPGREEEKPAKPAS